MIVENFVWATFYIKMNVLYWECLLLSSFCFSMSDELRKRSVARRRSASVAGSSSLSEGGAPPVSPRMMSTCGHSGCQDTCNVRYIGPVSHIRDHHALHAARGAGHIWAASIVTGFAIVLTGAIAFQSAQAKTEREARSNVTGQRSEQQELIERLNRLEALVRDTRRACGGGESVSSTPPVIPPRPGEGFGRRPTSTEDSPTSTRPNPDYPRPTTTEWQMDLKKE